MEIGGSLELTEPLLRVRTRRTAYRVRLFSVNGRGVSVVAALRCTSIIHAPLRCCLPVMIVLALVASGSTILCETHDGSHARFLVRGPTGSLLCFLLI